MSNSVYKVVAVVNFHSWCNTHKSRSVPQALWIETKVALSLFLPSIVLSYRFVPFVTHFLVFTIMFSFCVPSSLHLDVVQHLFSFHLISPHPSKPALRCRLTSVNHRPGPRPQRLMDQKPSLVSHHPFVLPLIILCLISFDHLHPQQQETLGFNFWKQAVRLCTQLPIILFPTEPFHLVSHHFAPHHPFILSRFTLSVCLHLVFLHLVSKHCVFHHPFMLYPFVLFPIMPSPAIHTFPTAESSWVESLEGGGRYNGLVPHHFISHHPVISFLIVLSPHHPLILSPFMWSTFIFSPIFFHHHHLFILSPIPFILFPSIPSCCLPVPTHLFLIIIFHFRSLSCLPSLLHLVSAHVASHCFVSCHLFMLSPI